MKVEKIQAYFFKPLKKKSLLNKNRSVTPTRRPTEVESNKN
jgi:hypothetical protein